MMALDFKRKVLMLSVGTGLMLSLWALGGIFSPERRAARGEASMLLSGKPDDAAFLEILRPSAQGAEMLSFSKVDEVWKLKASGAAHSGGDFPAQGARVQSFLSAIASVSRLKAVAKNKDAWASLGLDDAAATKVLVKDAAGKPLADFYLGGYGPSGDDLYLRRGGSEASYSAPASLASYTASGRRMWLDLAILSSSIPAADIGSFGLRVKMELDKGKPLSFEYRALRTAEGWKADNARLDPVAVDGLLRSALSLEAEDFADPAPADAFSPVGARLELSFGDGASRVIELGRAAGEGRYYLRVSGAPRVYEVSAYSLRSLLRSPAELRAKD